MQKRKKILIVLLVLFPILLSNCSDPVSPISEMDPELIGEWYKLDTLQSGFPSPAIGFDGIQIKEDKKIRVLGIETKTGKVEVIKDSYRKIVKANQGKIVFEYYVEGMQVFENNSYKIENNKLTISDNYLHTVYTKIKLGEQIFEPVTCNLSFEKDSIFYENEKISAYPSAYAGKISTSDFFLLNAEMDHAFLRIGINNFKGIGSYAIPYNEFEFGEFYGDVGIILVPDSLSKGEIIITQYDEVNSICSGTFYLNATMPDNPDSVVTIFKEGIFTVPIYK